MDGVFLRLAGLLQGTSQGQSPWKTPSICPLLLGLTYSWHYLSPCWHKRTPSLHHPSWHYLEKVLPVNMNLPILMATFVWDLLALCYETLIHKMGIICRFFFTLPLVRGTCSQIVWSPPQLTSGLLEDQLMLAAATGALTKERPPTKWIYVSALAGIYRYIFRA